MKKNQTNTIVIKDSEISKLILYILAFIIVVIIGFLAAWLLGITMDLAKLLPLLLLPSFLFLCLPIIAILDYRKTIISNQGIQFYCRKELIFSCSWTDIERINLYKERVYYPRGRHLREHTNIEYVIQFVGLKSEKTVRLWYFPFKVKTQELIIQSIKNLARTKYDLQIAKLPEDKEVKRCDRDYNRMHNTLKTDFPLNILHL